MTVLDDVTESAGEVFEPEGVTIWLDHPNRILGGQTPRQCMEAGDSPRVLALLEGLKDGVVF